MDDVSSATEAESVTDDVARAPGEASDPAEFVARYVPADVLARYEVFSYRNAALISWQSGRDVVTSTHGEETIH